MLAIDDFLQLLLQDKPIGMHFSALYVDGIFTSNHTIVPKITGQLTNDQSKFNGHLARVCCSIEKAIDLHSNLFDIFDKKNSQSCSTMASISITLLLSFFSFKIFTRYSVICWICLILSYLPLTNTCLLTRNFHRLLFLQMLSLARCAIFTFAVIMITNCCFYFWTTWSVVVAARFQNNWIVGANSDDIWIIGGQSVGWRSERRRLWRWPPAFEERARVATVERKKKKSLIWSNLWWAKDPKLFPFHVPQEHERRWKESLGPTIA